MVQHYSVLQELAGVSRGVIHDECELHNLPQLMSEDVSLQNLRVLSILLTFLRLLISAGCHVSDNLQELQQHLQCSVELFIFYGFLSHIFLAKHSSEHRAEQKVKRIKLQTHSNLRD